MFEQLVRAINTDYRINVTKNYAFHNPNHSSTQNILIIDIPNKI